MNKKENENLNSRPFLSKKAVKELRLREAEIRQRTAKIQKTLDKVLPPYSGKEHLIIK